MPTSKSEKMKLLQVFQDGLDMYPHATFQELYASAIAMEKMHGKHLIEKMQSFAWQIKEQGWCIHAKGWIATKEVKCGCQRT